MTNYKKSLGSTGFKIKYSNNMQVANTYKDLVHNYFYKRRLLSPYHILLYSFDYQDVDSTEYYRCYSFYTMVDDVVDFCLENKLTLDETSCILKYILTKMVESIEINFKRLKKYYSSQDLNGNHEVYTDLMQFCEESLKIYEESNVLKCKEKLTFKINLEKAKNKLYGVRKRSLGKLIGIVTTR
jgi:hypothetical protein